MSTGLQIGNKTRADKTHVKPEQNNRGWLLRQRRFADNKTCLGIGKSRWNASPNDNQLAVPTDILYRGRWQRVNRYWGPERIESGWWRGRAIRRDYYRLELATGLRFWVYKTLPGNRWFLQKLLTFNQLDNWTISRWACTRNCTANRISLFCRGFSCNGASGT